jgi:serine/threonine protein kinase/Tfp pilus assembly protein PilF
MSPSDWTDVERVLATVIELPKAERSARVVELCAHNAALRAEVESLLMAHESADSFMETGSLLKAGRDQLAVTKKADASCLAGNGVLSLDSEMTAAPLPTRIGRYRILRLLAEGGMGCVFEAEQEQPLRTVALKVIRPGMTSPEMLRRFEREFQILGRLQHPGIAQIYEAGTADTGFGVQPYIAMEFIRGTTVLQHANGQRLGTRERLELIVKVCDAVHHAHERGVIHRDLKPANILVDETGQPKILDMGIARLTNVDEQRTHQTDLGQLLGTLAYMSPEQVLADPSQLDSRTDVYSLGVILFELLAGHLPYTLSRRLDVAVHTIREEDPAPLSSISRRYRGDIEIIVARALEKDKARRYSSAAELRGDIQRYLNDQPILARRASTTYQMQKFARRHRALVIGVVAVFAVLVLGIIGSTWEATRARRAEQVATTESATAKAINEFLQNDLLAQASASVQTRPDRKPDPNLKVRTALDRAAERITGKFDKQPLVEASIRQTIGKTYRDLGLYQEADQQIERALDLQRRALGEKHPDTLATMNGLGELYQDQGDYAHAEPLFIRALGLRRQVLGEEHPDTLATMNDLATVYMNEGKYQQAEPAFVKVWYARQRTVGEEHPDALLSMNNLALLYQLEGKYSQAEPLCIRVQEVRRRLLGEEHPDTLISRDNLARLYLYQGKYAQAEPLFIAVLEGRRRVLGEEHPDTFISMNNLAVVYRKQGKYAQAEPLLKNGLELQRRRMGAENPDTLLMMNNLARLYLDQGRYAPAEPLFTQALAIQRRVLGEEHPETLTVMRNLAHLYRNQRKYAPAEALLKQVAQVQQRLLGSDHPDTLTTLNDLAQLYQDQGKYGQADPLSARVLEVRRRVLGDGHPDTVSALASLGRVRLGLRRYVEAESLLRAALSAQEKNSPDAWQRYNIQSLLGACLAAQARFEEAEPLTVSAYQGLSQRHIAIPRDSWWALDQAAGRIVQLYRAWGRPQQAAEWRRKLEPEISAAHHQ